MERIFARIGETVKLEDGRTVVFEKKEKGSKKRPGSTALHEARHAVAAEANGTSVVYATIVPGPGYLGLTQLSRFDAVAAAAPHAHGDAGTSHDVFIIEHAGESVSGAGAAAKRILSGRSGQVYAVASEMEAAGTLGGSAIRRAMADASKGPELVMRILSPQGKTIETRKVEPANENLIQIPREISKAA